MELPSVATRSNTGWLAHVTSARLVDVTTALSSKGTEHTAGCHAPARAAWPALLSARDRTWFPANRLWNFHSLKHRPSIPGHNVSHHVTPFFRTRQSAGSDTTRLPSLAHRRGHHMGARSPCRGRICSYNVDVEMGVGGPGGGAGPMLHVLRSMRCSRSGLHDR